VLTPLELGGKRKPVAIEVFVSVSLLSKRVSDLLFADCLISLL